MGTKGILRDALVGVHGIARQRDLGIAGHPLEQLQSIRGVKLERH